MIPNSFFLSLKIAVPNNVQILGATSQTVNLGGRLTLQCSGQGDPAPTLSWIFSSSTSDATTVGTGTTYSITNAQRTNGGTYVCRGTNSLGSTDSQGVTVDVQCKSILEWIDLCKTSHLTLLVDAPRIHCLIL